MVIGLSAGSGALHRLGRGVELASLAEPPPGSSSRCWPTGLDLASTSTLARTTRTHGNRARDLIATERAALAGQGVPVPAATTTGPDLCYIILDGTGAPMLPSECAGRPGKDPAKHPDGRAGTREVKIGCFFTQSGLNPVTGDPIQDPGSATYISTFEGPVTFGAHAKAEYRRRGFDQIREPIVLGDGAKWIWGIADQHFPHATQIVDYFHAREHLADLTKTLTPVLTDPAGFEQALIDHLDLGATTAITDAVARLDLPQHAPHLVKPAATETGYFIGNHHRMQYADFRANGYYIGSGPVEAVLQHHRQTTRQTRRHALEPSEDSTPSSPSAPCTNPAETRSSG